MSLAKNLQTQWKIIYLFTFLSLYFIIYSQQTLFRANNIFSFYRFLGVPNTSTGFKRNTSFSILKEGNLLIVKFPSVLTYLLSFNSINDSGGKHKFFSN